MNLNYAKTIGPRLKVIIAVAVAGSLIVVYLVQVYGGSPPSSRTASRTNIANPFVTTTSTTTTTLGPGVSESDLEGEGQSISDDYSGRAIPSDKFESVYPESSSGLDGATSTKVRALGLSFVTADVTLQGRDEFRGYWPNTTTPTTALCPAITIDFTTAMKVENHSSLVRVVVIWHGDTWTGTRIIQMRKAVYFTVGAGGSLKPVRIQDLPKDLIGLDPLIDGERI